MSHGVKDPPKRKPMLTIPIIEPTLLSRNCFLSSLKKLGIAIEKGIKEVHKIKADIVKII
jgi:hypothetical protein